jgi:hypothetical protein
MHGRSTIIVLVLAALSCRQTSPDQKLVESLGPSASWVRSLQMIGEKWLANSVPENFVRTAVAAADKDFQKAEKGAAASRADQALRSRIVRDLHEARAITATLRAGARANDRRIAERAIRRVPALSRELDSLERQYKGSQ